VLGVGVPDDDVVTVHLGHQVGHRLTVPGHPDVVTTEPPDVPADVPRAR
jgi:hypothetical protein